MQLLDCIIGIDVGKKGGIAIYYRGKYKVHRMPNDITLLNNLLTHYRDVSETILVLIESVRLWPGDIKQKPNEPDEKTFGRINRLQQMVGMFEKIKAIMLVGGIPYMEIHPGTWQSYLNLKANRSMDVRDRKRVYQKFASSVFPEKINMDVADAVCILIYGIRNLKYNPDFIEQLPKTVQKKLL